MFGAGADMAALGMYTVEGLSIGFAPGEDMAADFLVYLVGLGTEFATGAEKGGLVVVVGSVFVVSLPLILS